MVVDPGADVLEGDVAHGGLVAVEYVHENIRRADDVDVAEDDVADRRRKGLGADTHPAAPVAPDDAAFERHVLDRLVADEDRLGLAAVLRQSLDDQRIVERAHEAVLHTDPRTVHHVDAVRVVTPLPDNLHIVDLDVRASEQGAAPHRGVAQYDAFDLHVAAIRESESRPRAALELAAVDRAAAPDADIRGVHGVEAAENHGVGSQIDPGAGLELDAPRTVYAGSVVVGDGPLGRHVRLRGAGEEMQSVVGAVDLEREVPRLGARQRERDLLSLDPGLDPGPRRIDPHGGYRLADGHFDLGRAAFGLVPKSHEGYFGLVHGTLVAVPHLVEGNGRNTARIGLHRLAVHADGISAPVETILAGVRRVVLVARRQGAGEYEGAKGFQEIIFRSKHRVLVCRFGILFCPRRQ